jgi:carbamoylphosphate synthase large subunit
MKTAYPTRATRILVTGAGGPAGSALIRQLTARGIGVIGVDMAEVSLPGVVTYVVPPAADPQMIAALREIVDLHGIDVVIPTVSEELPTVAAAAHDLGARVVIGAPDAVEVADDKLTTALCLSAHGVAVPDFGLPSEFASVAHAGDVLGRPFIAKPRVSRGGRGVIVVRSEADIDWSALDDSTILQSFAPGTEWAPVVQRDPAGLAAPFAAVLEKTGLAGGEVGNATGVRPVEHSGVAELALAAAEAVGLAGPVDMDIRAMADGRPVVLEINARFGANSAAAPGLLTAVLASVCLPLESSALRSVQVAA